MKQLLKEGIRRLFIANRGPGNRQLGIILRDAKAGSDEAPAEEAEAEAEEADAAETEAEEAEAEAEEAESSEESE